MIATGAFKYTNSVSVLKQIPITWAEGLNNEWFFTSVGGDFQWVDSSLLAKIIFPLSPNLAPGGILDNVSLEYKVSGTGGVKFNIRILKFRFGDTPEVVAGPIDWTPTTTSKALAFFLVIGSLNLPTSETYYLQVELSTDTVQMHIYSVLASYTLSTLIP